MRARYLVDDKLVATTDEPEIRKAIADDRLIWIEIEDHCDDAQRLLVEDLKLHPLTVEDIWLSRSAPKIDDFEHYLFVLIHGVAGGTRKVELVELDIVIGKRFLVTRDPANLVGEDLRAEIDRSPRLLQKGIAWLAHAVLDRAVDKYLPVIDELDDEIEKLQDDVIDRAGTPRGRGVLSRILSFKRTLQEIRRMGIYQREILLRLSRGEYEEIPIDALPFYRDVYDHFLRINDVVEGYRDLVTSALDAYLSVQSNRMNEIMKTLTLMSTVMLPLTFIAGVYGMNFKTMPETQWVFGYPMAVGFMALVALGIMLWFRRKGWIGKAARGDALSNAAMRAKREKKAGKPNGKPKRPALGKAAAAVHTHQLPKINLETLE